MNSMYIESSRRERLHVYRPAYTNAITTLALAFALTAGVVAVAAASADVRLLPYMLIGPRRLDPGAYETRPAFVPATTFTVGRGWYGGQGSHTEWCVGKGLHGRGGNYGSAAICGFRLWLPYAAAVSRFRALKTLDAGPSTPVEMGGFRGVSFRAVVRGDLAPTRGLPFSSTLPYRPRGVRPGGQQIFLNVRGTTLLLQIEIFARKAGKPAVRGFLRTVQFPR